MSHVALSNQLHTEVLCVVHAEKCPKSQGAAQGAFPSLWRPEIFKGCIHLMLNKVKCLFHNPLILLKHNAKHSTFLRIENEKYQCRAL